MGPPPALDQDDDVDKDDYRRSSLFVFEGNGVVSQFQGTYSEYFTALKANGGSGASLPSGFTTEYITGFDSPPPLPILAPPIPPPDAVATTPTVLTIDTTKAFKFTKPAPKLTPPPPKPVKKVPPINTGPAPSQRSLERLEKTMKDQKKAVKGKKKIKVTKKEREEYETIEAEVE